jgi:hypothetical protein
MNEPVQKFNSSLFQIAKWNNKGKEYDFINYSIQKSFKVEEEWNKQTITSLSISDVNRLKTLLDEVIREHFIKKGN